MCEPYATVIDIDFERLPSPAAVAAWSSGQFTAALRHDPSCADFNPHFRQLLHVGYKMAAGLGDTYLEALETHRASIAPCVTENILERHIKPLFYTAP